MNNPIVRILLLALLIFCGGWLGMMMVVPPGYASPLWPPAGISLAGLLLMGHACWPGILLGAIANQLYAAFLFSGQFNLISLASSLLIAFGSTLQGLLGFWLSRKWVGNGVPNLDSPRQILTFSLLTGPLSCVLAPSIGMLALVGFDLLPLSEAGVSWFNWWIGDTLGVLLLTPLAFCYFAQPRKFWRLRLTSVSLPLALTLTGIAITFVVVYDAEKIRTQMEFDNRAAGISRLLIDSSERIVDRTRSLAEFFNFSGPISRQVFADLAQSILSQHPEIQALEWLPKLEHPQLAEFERQVRAEGFSDFQVHERNENNQLRPVQFRDRYFPILYLEPLAQFPSLLGFDAASHDESWQSKQKAIDSRQISASQPLKLLAESGGQAGLLISVPVFDLSGDKSASNRLLGFISALIVPNRIIDGTLEGIDLSGLHFKLQDLDAPPQDAELFNQPVINPLNPSYDFKPWQTSFLFCDRRWQITVTADREFVIKHGSTLPWTTLIGGLFFTSLMSMLLLVISGRNAQIEALVDIRTRELERTNAELRNTERTLRESETRMRTLVDSQPECIKLLSREGQLLDMNPAGLAIIGAESLQEAQSGNVLDLVLPAYREAFASVNAATFSGQSGSLEFEIRNLKGELRWLETHAVPLRNASGEIVAALGITRDISEHKRLDSALRQNQQRLAAILDNLGACVFLKDLEGRYLYANRAVCELWNTTPEAIVGQTDAAFFDQAACRVIAGNDRRVLVDGETIKQEEKDLRALSGKTATYLTTKLPLRDEHGQLYALLGISTDITELKHNEDNLKLAARVFGEAHEGILITDAKGVIIDVNPTFCEITGFSRGEAIGKNPHILKSGHHSAEFYADMWQSLLQTKHWQGEIWNRKKDGDLFAELLTISALCDEQGNIINFVGLFSDITQSKQQQQMLELMAHYDPLTRLPNRTLFADRLLQAIARSRREKSLLAICFLDLDGFKPINDQFGHEAGDQILVEVANRIKNSIREEDTVSRHGGDEFALLMSNLHSVEECEQAMQRIHQVIVEPYFVKSQPVVIGVSSGVTIFPIDDADSDTLLRHADHAMYQAKLAGKNRYHLFDFSQDQLVIDKNKQLREIQAAFDAEQFALYYQPKVDMRSGKFVGVEALIRWIHPERGIVPPLAFLPAIACNELEITIGNWVIEQAWRQLQRWHAQGFELEVSINVSSYHLLSPNFIANLEELLKQAPHIPSSYLQLEILESTALDDLSTVNRVIKACRELLGVTVALDDFGTGYSSLAHLRHLPVDTVKIDKSFVRDMLEDPDDYAIVEGVIGLSHAFSREVIAEGVEDHQQGTVLLLLGCHVAQGYFIAKPMPAQQIGDWAQNYQAHPDWRDYANSNLNNEQTLLTIRRIDLGQWMSRVEHCLGGEQNKVCWPAMDGKHTHFGRWLSKAIHQEQYNRARLEGICESYKSLLQLSSELMQQSWSFPLGSDNANLEQVREVYRQLDQCLLELIDEQP